MTPSKTPANYLYWQEHGCDWYGEYEKRKKHIVYYHIQELMLADYFHHSTPAKVLEFGCGIGRHLRYLSQIPDLDVYGYDQSKTMAEGCYEWADEKWVSEHVWIGQPLQKLPYPDSYFDIVFTAEVLVHVRPEDIMAVLLELLRISKWQVLHLETALGYELVENVHGGCWYHDLVQYYKKAGYLCQLITKGYRAHSPYRVILDPDRQVFTWPDTVLSKYYELEEKIQGTINCKFTEKADIENLSEENNLLRTAMDEIKSAIRLSG